MSTVLHPSLRSEWFKTTVPACDTASSPMQKAKVEAAQRDAVEKAELLFAHVACIYYNNTPVSDTASKLTEAKNTSHTSRSDPIDCLADICDFEVVTAPVAESEDRLQDELRQYFKFEGGRTSLAASLAWWKVSPLSQLLISSLISKQKHAALFPTLARMVLDPCYECFCATDLLKITAHM